jgi:hypothetical protein
MKYAVEMASAAMIYTYTPSFTETGSGIQNLPAGVFTNRKEGA